MKHLLGEQAVVFNFFIARYAQKEDSMKTKTTPARRNEHAVGVLTLNVGGSTKACSFSGRAGKARSARNKRGQVERDHQRFYA